MNKEYKLIFEKSKILDRWFWHLYEADNFLFQKFWHLVEIFDTKEDAEEYLENLSKKFYYEIG